MRLGENIWTYMKVYPRVCGGTTGTVRGAVVPKGSIPACAGEPAVYFCRGTSGVAGLSPRVRGNHLLHVYAASPRWVYPRVCGGTAFAL